MITLSHQYLQESSSSDRSTSFDNNIQEETEAVESITFLARETTEDRNAI